MTKEIRGIDQYIGNTPLIRISKGLYAKLETLNPTGSIKDRMANAIINNAELRGDLKPKGTIIEATSGNSGIAFSMLAALKGYKMIVVMPRNMSDERKKMIRGFGAEIVEVGDGDFNGAVEKRDELVVKLKAFSPDQFCNPDNPECHYQTTGQEILRQVADAEEGRPIVAFAAGTGTGGTLMGVRKALIEHFPSLQTIAVEPTESSVMKGGMPGLHSIQGIGDGFIPPLVDMNLVDHVSAVSSADAIKRMKRLMSEMGLFVGISSGANVLAAERYMEDNRPEGVVVTVLPDRGERYLSMI